MAMGHGSGNNNGDGDNDGAMVARWHLVLHSV